MTNELYEIRREVDMVQAYLPTETVIFEVERWLVRGAINTAVEVAYLRGVQHTSPPTTAFSDRRFHAVVPVPDLPDFVTTASKKKSKGEKRRDRRDRKRMGWTR